MRPISAILKLSPAGKLARPDAGAPVSEIRDLVRRTRARARRAAHARSGPWNPHLDAAELQVGAAPHADDARLRRPHAAHPAPGKDLLLHEVHSAKEAVSVAQWRWRCDRQRHAVPVVPQPGPATSSRGRRLLDLMCQMLSNTRDMCKGRQLPGRCTTGATATSSRSRGNLDDAVPAGRRLGDGGGDQGRRRTSRRAGSAKAPARKPTSITPLTFAVGVQAPVIL